MSDNNYGKKDIWILHHYATPPSMSGLTRPYEFSTQLKKYGYESTIFSSAYLHYTNENLITDKRKHLEDSFDGVKFNFIRTSKYKGNGISRIKNMLSFAYNILAVSKRVLRNTKKPTIIYASSPHPLTLISGRILAKRYNIPCICEVRDFWPEVFFIGGKLKEDSIIGNLLLKGENWIYKNADGLIFLKEGDINYLVEKKWDLEQGGNVDLNKCYYINNGVNIGDYNSQIKVNILKDEDLDSNKFKVVYTGAIRPVNNVGNILDTAKILKDNGDIQFLIYGEGNQKEILEQRIIDEDISNVKIKGYVEKKYIPYILSKSSVNILNYSQTQYNWSRGNSSNKLFEYMASGKPIISTVKMGYSIIEKYNCGIELEDGTPEELANAILRIKDMKKEKYEMIGKNAKKGAEDFDFKVLTGKLVEVINTVSKEN